MCFELLSPFLPFLLPLDMPGAHDRDIVSPSIYLIDFLFVLLLLCPAVETWMKEKGCWSHLFPGLQPDLAPGLYCALGLDRRPILVLRVQDLDQRQTLHMDPEYRQRTAWNLNLGLKAQACFPTTPLVV